MTHTFPEAGEFSVALTVIDEEGNEATETNSVTVFPDVPVAVTRETTTISSPVTLQVDPGAEGLPDEATYDWVVTEGGTYDLLHGDNLETPHVALTPYEEGSYTLTVTVTDAEGSTAGLGRREITVEQSARDEMVSTTLDGVEWVAELAEQYAPVIHFHADEKYFPTRYEAYVENARVHADDELVMERPSLIELGREDDHDGFELADENNDLQLIGTDEKVFQDYQAEYPRTVYASLTTTTVDGESPFGSEGKEYLALTYWLFYLYDPKSDDVLESMFEHASDTERITILLDENGPQWIAAAQHYSGEYVPWENYRDWVERTTSIQPSSPHVYPAVGAHSSFLVNTDEYEGGIPAQLRWLPWNNSLWPLSSTGDETGNHSSWSVTGDDTAESYDLLVLPEDSEEPWTQFGGTFTSEVAPNPLAESGLLPWRRGDQWGDPIPWVESRMLPEIDVLTVTQRDPRIYFSRDPGGEVTVFTIRPVVNLGLKPHEFVLDATIETSDASVDQQYEDRVGLGWNETTTIRIPLDDIQLPGDETVTVSAELLTHDPAVSSTENVVYDVERTAPVDIGLGLDAADASLSTERAAVDASTVAPGDEVRASTTLENTGDEQHTFFVSFTPVGEDGEPYTPAEPIGEPVTLNGGEQRTIDLSWTVEASIPEGTYDIELAGWYESDPTELVNQLVSVTREEAFTVDKPEGTLEVTTTPENALVTVGDRFTEEAPLTAAVPIGTYEVVAVSDGHGEARREVTVREGKTTAIVLDLDPALEPIVGDDPPQDLDDDGLYEDLDGDGDFSIGDVQVFFQHRNSDIVQDNAGFFNFSGTDPDEVTIGDVQALFQLFQDQN